MAMEEKSSRRISRLSLCAGFVAAESYSAYASFIGHALQPVSVFVFDRYTHQRLPAGHLGDLEAVIHWPGFIAIVAISLVVFAFAWSALYLAAKGLRQLTTNNPIAGNSAPGSPKVLSGSAVASG